MRGELELLCSSVVHVALGLRDRLELLDSDPDSSGELEEVWPLSWRTAGVSLFKWRVCIGAVWLPDASFARL